MENMERLYIISFGDSAKFRMSYPGTKEQLEASDKMKGVESALAKVLQSKVPVSVPVKMLTTPIIKEFDAVDAAKYAGYRDFSTVNFDDLKSLVLKEAMNIQAQKSLDRDAPFAQIN